MMLSKWRTKRLLNKLSVLDNTQRKRAAEGLAELGQPQWLTWIKGDDTTNDIERLRKSRDALAKRLAEVLEKSGKEYQLKLYASIMGPKRSPSLRRTRTRGWWSLAPRYTIPINKEQHALWRERYWLPFQERVSKNEVLTTLDNTVKTALEAHDERIALRGLTDVLVSAMLAEEEVVEYLILLSIVFHRGKKSSFENLVLEVLFGSNPHTTTAEQKEYILKRKRDQRQAMFSCIAVLLVIVLAIVAVLLGIRAVL